MTIIFIAVFVAIAYSLCVGLALVILAHIHEPEAREGTNREDA